MKNILPLTKALADKNRLMIVFALMRHEELCACQLIELLQVSGATSSRHLSILVNANLIESRKDGRWVYYRLSKNIHDDLCGWLRSAMAESVEFKAIGDRLDQILSLAVETICKKQRC